MAFTPKYTLFELTTRVETPVVKITRHTTCRPRPQFGSDGNLLGVSPEELAEHASRLHAALPEFFRPDGHLDVFAFSARFHQRKSMKKAPDNSGVTLDSCLPMETNDGQ